MVTNKSTSTGFPLFLDLFVSNFKHYLVQTLVKFVPFKPLDTETKQECDSRKMGDLGRPIVLGELDEKLSKEDVKTVMNKLGMTMSCDDHDHYQFGGEEVMRVFDEEEPSLAELKEAFNVFDANKDGFIDASELARVLCNLGLVKEPKKSECLRMIKAVDGNDDGVVDFSEFVKFMESCFF